MALVLAIVDTSALYAAVDASEIDHQVCVAALSRPDLHFVIPVLVVAETCQLLERRRGPAVEAAFLITLQDYHVLAPSADDWERMSELVRHYADFPLGAVDASVVALAERLQAETIVTLDRRHFSAVRPRHTDYFRLLPP